MRSSAGSLRRSVAGPVEYLDAPVPRRVLKRVADGNGEERVVPRLHDCDTVFTVCHFSVPLFLFSQRRSVKRLNKRIA